MIRIYTFILYLVVPLAFLRLWWRGFRQPAYRQHWRERLGSVAGEPGDATSIWVHAVSVGEVRAAAPLVNALLKEDPGRSLLITTTTPTGRETVAQLFGKRVVCCYLPWDLPGAIRRFLAAIKPVKVIVLETELWPNLFQALKQRGIPLYLVNARMSENSLRGYRRVPSLVRTTLDCVTGIAAQGEADTRRFVALGAQRERVVTVGNLKYDVELPEDFDQRRAGLQLLLGQRGHLWVAGSTHPAEDGAVLDVHRQLLARYPDCLLLLVPRHPERARDLVALCQQAGMSVALYSGLNNIVLETTQVVVVDVLGELVYLYGLAPVAFVGGSLLPHGGHNPLEALQAGCAVVSGKYVDNFSGIYRQLENAGAVTRVADKNLLYEAVETLLDDAGLRQRQRAAGKQVAGANRGALGRVLAMIG